MYIYIYFYFCLYELHTDPALPTKQFSKNPSFPSFPKKELLLFPASNLAVKRLFFAGQHYAVLMLGVIIGERPAR